METTDKVYLYGASGHAKVVMDIAKLAYMEVPSLIDDNPDVKELAGLPVVHSADGLSPIIVTIGDCQIRKKIVQKLGYKDYMTVVHPNAIKAESVKLGFGTVVMAGAILNPYVEVGDHCIINTGASLDHDVPHCTLCGEVEIGDGTWVGAGSTVIQCLHIGKNCFIGAGSVVVDDIPDNCMCYWNPARIIKYKNMADNQVNNPAGGNKYLKLEWSSTFNFERRMAA